MPGVIIPDTSCIIVLNQIGELDILRMLFGEVLITPLIAEEYGRELPDWIKVVNPANGDFQYLLNAMVDLGEASALALAFEHKNSLLILDDVKARRVALKLGLKFTGTLGILVEAKLSGHIPLLRPIVDKIRATNFRLTAELERIILHKTGE